MQLITKSKAGKWKELCENLDKDIWGDGYRIVMRQTVKQRPYDLRAEKKKEIFKVFFPSIEDKMFPPTICGQVKPFTKEELYRGVDRIKSGKASDGIPPEVIREAVKLVPEWMLGVMNGLLEKQEFPNA